MGGGRQEKGEYMKLKQTRKNHLYITHLGSWKNPHICESNLITDGVRNWGVSPQHKEL